MQDQVEQLRQRHLRDKVPTEAAYFEMIQLARNIHREATRDATPDEEELNQVILKKDKELTNVLESNFNLKRKCQVLEKTVEHLSSAILPNSALENIRMVTAMARCNHVESLLLSAHKAGKEMRRKLDLIDDLWKKSLKGPAIVKTTEPPQP